MRFDVRRRGWMTVALLVVIAAWDAGAGWSAGSVFAQDGGTRHEFSVLVFSKTAGFRHGSIERGIDAIRNLGEQQRFRVDATEDAGRFTDESLADFDVVIFLSTTGDVLDAEQEDAFERFIQGGGGFVGIHAASDTEYDWPWYGQLVGAYFKSHPSIQDATIIVADSLHPSTSMLEQRWDRRDEWYNFHQNPRGRVHVLATLDERTYNGGEMGHDHPIVWCHLFDGGRAWYTGGGHTNESFAEPAFIAHLLGGIRWAAGAVDGDAGATVDGHFDKVVLDEFVTDPMELAIAPDGRVIFVERGGSVKVWSPETRSTSNAGFIDVFTGLEDGLLGITLDPDFEKNEFIYLYYAPAGDEAINVLSRWRLAGLTLDPKSEVIMLEVETQRDECCHSGGSLTFDGDGNLYISTGDNTSPFASDGYAPIDERDGRAPYDAQKSSANTHDLRGKILRIHPIESGRYRIPPGNLFPPDGSLGRPEIYAMGCRNPFRISVDSRNGTLYWGEVGPDAGSPNPERGPAGHDEFNRTRTAGNFGWPYFVGNNKPYHDYDFEKALSGPEYDPHAPVNESPNNTGHHRLPPARPAWMWYPYGASPEFPELETGGRCAMAGPVYHHVARLDSARKFPRYFDGAIFLYEWSRDWIGVVKMDEHDGILKIHRIFPTMQFIRPMEMEMGPDGCLYIIEWGTGFGGGNADSQIVRLEYHPTGERPPVARATADRTSGAAPLTVDFSCEGTHARGAARGGAGRGVTLAWDFDGDGVIDSHAPNPRHTYAAHGRFNAQLIATDSLGLSAVANVPITVGNTAPQVQIEWPPDGGFFEFGDTVAYRTIVTDPEDALFDTERISVQPYLGHDTHAHPLHQHSGFEGSFRTLRDGGHGADADLFTVLAATYTDRGGPAPVPALSARAEVVLQPKRKQAEYASVINGPRLEKADDPDGGGQAVVFTAAGDHATYGPVNLLNIDAAVLRLAAGSDGGALTVRLDAVDGPVLGRASVEPSGLHELAAGPHPIRIEYFERGGGAGLILRATPAGRAKSVVDASMFTHGDDEAPGLAAQYYILDDPTSLPDFAALEPFKTDIVERINFASTNDTFAGSGRKEHVGAVLSGHFNVPSPTAYTFSLESDDGSRLYLNGELLVDNDGLHAMVEKSAALQWLDVRIPLVDPGGTHTLFVVFEPDGESPSPIKLNWIEFLGRGVTETAGSDLPDPGEVPVHGH